MKRGVFNAGSRISLTRKRASKGIAQYVAAAARNQVLPPVDNTRRGTTLSERLKQPNPQNRTPVSTSEDVLNRTQAKTGNLLRTLHHAAMPVAPLYGPEGQFNSPSDWRPEDWKDDWGSDTLRPTESAKDSKRDKPPHIGGTPPPSKTSPPSKKKSVFAKKRAPIAYTRKIEGLLDPSENPVLLDVAPTSEHKPIATLEHGLDRVLFNQGVHWLQDPRSRVYNFPPHLENIPKVTDFAFERLPGFIKSSRDEDLRTLAKRQGGTFAGSTSSLTGMLSHCYFLMSEHKTVDISSLSQTFKDEEKNFTPGQRMPTSVLFNYKDGVYAIDSDSEDTSKNILTWLGTLLEKFLTMSKAEFSTYLRSSPPFDAEEEPMREAYRYAKSEKFVMRSQLDCVDRRLPGTGVFDIKTRACLPVRMDILNHEENSGYMIRSAQGLYESFEREYYDLIRSAFLKYGFQVRIGNMDGVIVAYHNTARMFGFQYVSLDEMDQRLFGSEPGVGDRVFQKCVGLLECISSEIIQCFPNQSVKCTFECEEGSRDLNVWVQPTDWTPVEEGVEPPIKQLAVRTQSFLHDAPTKGYRAVAAPANAPWTLHWSIAHLSDNQEEIRKNYMACLERKFRAYSLPTGVSFEDLPQYWSELNYGNESKSQEPAATDEVILPSDFDYTKFRLPNERVQILRDLARSGREFSERLQLADAGRKKVVLGEPFDISDAEIEVYKAEEERESQNELQSEVAPSVREDQPSASVTVSAAPLDVADELDLEKIVDSVPSAAELEAQDESNVSDSNVADDPTILNSTASVGGRA
ncbi:mitochondrial protein Pet127-domain-containing protein [Mycena sp. CBHHK59/15]|nr:mitochondrial protein Pet127-domain-containing protein [Mycena sp. CBHHK59/15]